MEEEIWKDIEGYEGLYQVSNWGRIKSYSYNVRNKYGYLKFKLTIHGYFMVTLVKNKVRKYHLISRLVAKTFVANLENKPQVNHIDGNKQNNYYKNLEWCTQSENMLHAYKNGLEISCKGQSHGRSKLVNGDIRLIKKLHNTYKLTNANIAKIFNISQPMINLIVNNKNWIHLNAV